MSLAAALDSETVHVLAQASGGGLRYALCDVTFNGVGCDPFVTIDPSVSSGAFACARVDALTGTLLVSNQQYVTAAGLRLLQLVGDTWSVYTADPNGSFGSFASFAFAPSITTLPQFLHAKLRNIPMQRREHTHVPSEEEIRRQRSQVPPAPVDTRAHVEPKQTRALNSQRPRGTLGQMLSLRALPSDAAICIPEVFFVVERIALIYIQTASKHMQFFFVQTRFLPLKS